MPFESLQARHGDNRIENRSRRQVRIAIVDDDPVDQRYLTHLLAKSETYDFEIVCASTYEEGRVLLTNDTFDAAIVDWNLAGNTGVDLTKELNGRDSATPIILYTGFGGYEVDCEGLEAGAYAFLDKNVLTAVDLDRCIRHVIHQKKLEAALTRAREDAERANEAKTRFLAYAAHDLKGPLTSVLGFSDLIEKSQKDDKFTVNVQEYTSYIKISAELLNNLITNMSTFAHLGINDITLNPRMLCAADEIQNALDLLHVEAEEKDIEIDSSAIDPALMLYADKMAFTKVIANIVANALNGARRDSFIAISTEQRQRGIAISVTDNGYGIDTAELKRIQEAFLRGNADEVVGVPRVGLGLAIAKQFMDHHNGSLELICKPGEQTTVCVVFPHGPERSDDPLKNPPAFANQR